jgi:hypothetical protein
MGNKPGIYRNVRNTSGKKCVDYSIMAYLYRSSSNSSESPVLMRSKPNKRCARSR